jgi:hypothetical protein
MRPVELLPLAISKLVGWHVVGDNRWAWHGNRIESNGCKNSGFNSL